MVTIQGVRPMAGPVLYTVVFLAFLDTFALLPTIGPYAEALGATPFMVGVAVASYSASNLLFNVVGGFVVDRLGRVAVLVAGLVVAAVAVVTYPLATSPAMLVTLRLLHGAGGGLVMPALFTLVGDIAADGQRGRAMGRAGAFIGLAAVVGPMAAGIIRATLGTTAVFVGIACLLLLAALTAATCLRPKAIRLGEMSAAERTQATETAEPSFSEAENRRHAGGSREAPGSSEAGAAPLPARRRTILLATCAVFGFTAVFGTLAAFLPGHLDALTRTAVGSGVAFSAISGLAALLMLSPLARWVDVSGPRSPLVVGLTGFAAATAVLALTTSLAATVVAASLFGIAFGILFPAATGAVAIAADAPRRGRAFGWFNAAYSLGFIIGPPIGGLAVAAALSAFLPVAVVCAVLAVVLAVSLPAGRSAPRWGGAT